MDDPFVARRAGVESREEVLRQARENRSTIIELDREPTPFENRTNALQQSDQPNEYLRSDEPTTVQPLIQKRIRDPDPADHTEPVKQRKLMDGSGVIIGALQSPGKEPNTGSMSISTKNSTVRVPKQKKSLWCSSSAQDNMSKMSSLPSPESTISSGSVPSISDKKQSGPTSFSSSFWSFENLDEPSAIHDSDSTNDRGQIDAEPGVGGFRNSMPIRNLGALLDPLERKKKDLEQSGIAESQRLRVQNQNRPGRPTLVMSSGSPQQSYPRNSKSLAQSGSSQDATIHTQKVRPSNAAEENPEDLEQYFDILLGHNRSQQGIPVKSGERRQNTRQNLSHSSTLSPYSREAAERWRTQDRHLVRPQQAATKFASKTAGEHEALDLQDKETRIALVRAGAYQTKFKRDREAEQRLLSKKFYGVDLESRPRKTKPAASKPKPPSRTKADAQSDLQKLMGTDSSSITLNISNTHEMEGDIDEENEQRKESQQPSLPVPSLSALNKLNSITGKPGATWKPEDLALMRSLDDLPEQGNVPSSALSKYFNSYTKNEQNIFVERETKKERDKDLELIRTVFTIGAQLGSLDAFDTSDAKLLSYMTIIRKFTEAILERQKSGRPVRSRLRAIRDYFKRRLDSVGREPDSDAADQYLPILLKPELFEKLSAETSEVQERLSYLQPESYRIVSFYHSKFASASKKNQGTSKKGPSGKLIGSRPPTKNQKLAELRALRAQYDQNSQDGEDDAEIINLGASRDDNDGEVSEEDEGEDFMRPAGFQRQLGPNAPNDETSLDEVNRPENDPQQAKSQLTSQIQPSQGVNQQLLNNMLAKRQQQAHLQSQGAQKSDAQIAQETRQRKTNDAASGRRSARLPAGASISDESDEEMDYDIEQESSQEFDDANIDTDDDDGGDDGDESEPMCKRYVAKAACYGVSKTLDADEYLLGNYLNKEAARKKVFEFKDWIREQLPKCRPELDLDIYTESTSGTKGTFEQKVVFGNGADVVCRAWFDEELYNPSEEAYQKAKVYRACQPTTLWFVNWERTIGPYKEPAEDEGFIDESTNESDSLNALENEEGSGEDADTSESTGTQQDTTPESVHEADTEDISTELNQLNDDLVSSDSPVKSSTMSSAATLVPETDDNTKDQPTLDADTNDKIDDDSPIIEEDLDDLFSGEPEDVPVSAEQPTPPLLEPSSPESPSSEPSAQPDSTPYPASRQTTIIRPTPEQLRHYTTRSLANRHAKEVFMRWFIERLPGLENQAYISLEDRSVEEELMSLGDRSCWEREEEFYRIDDSVPGGEAKLIDRLRVWVTETKASGPRN